MAIVCKRCSAKQGILSLLTTDLGTGSNICSKCIEDEQERVRQLRQLSHSVIVTTTPGIDGFRVTNYLGIESVEYVIGTGFFSEASTEIEDFFGQRSSAFEKKLAIAKRDAMEMLKFKAAENGADAVVAIDIDYTEFSGNRIALIINGTLVMLAPEEYVGRSSQHSGSDAMSRDDELTVENEVRTNYATLANDKVLEDQEPINISEVLEQQATQMFAEARQFAQHADHQNAAFLLQEIVRRFPKTQIANKARRTLQKNGIET